MNPPNSHERADTLKCIGKDERELRVVTEQKISILISARLEFEIYFEILSDVGYTYDVCVGWTLYKAPFMIWGVLVVSYDVSL